MLFFKDIACAGMAIALFSSVAAATVINGGSFNCPPSTGDTNGDHAVNGASLVAGTGCTFGSTSANIGLEVSDSSSFLMTGGSISGSNYGLDVDGTTGAINISGGTISANSAFVIDGNYVTTPITISGGSFQGGTGGVGLDAFQGSSSIVNISLGAFSGRDAIRAASSATINIAGGTIGSSSVFGVAAEANAFVNITGGTFQGSFAALYAQDNAVINIYGTGLQKSGGFVVGTLESGQTIDANYSTLGHGQINVFSVPEPASLVLMGGGLIALAAVRRRRA